MHLDRNSADRLVIFIISCVTNQFNRAFELIMRKLLIPVRALCLLLAGTPACKSQSLRGRSNPEARSEHTEKFHPPIPKQLLNWIFSLLSFRGLLEERERRKTASTTSWRTCKCVCEREREMARERTREKERNTNEVKCALRSIQNNLVYFFLQWRLFRTYGARAIVRNFICTNDAS